MQSNHDSLNAARRQRRETRDLMNNWTGSDVVLGVDYASDSPPMPGWTVHTRVVKNRAAGKPASFGLSYGMSAAGTISVRMASSVPNRQRLPIQRIVLDLPMRVTGHQRRLNARARDRALQSPEWLELRTLLPRTAFYVRLDECVAIEVGGRTFKAKTKPIRAVRAALRYARVYLYAADPFGLDDEAFAARRRHP